MKPFMDEEFLLHNEPARVLYHGYAEQTPIIDYHCHVNPAEIADDRRYDNITQVWLGGDHYKWRAMRCNGVPEEAITGSLESDPWRVFENWAATMPRALGNPLYHWTHLELQRYFGVTKPLCPETAREIYETCNARLAEPDMSVRGIIAQSNVKLICTTDDPLDDLADHARIAADPTCPAQVLPAFRPDKALHADKAPFASYVKALGEKTGRTIDSFDRLVEALYDRIDYFAARGCRVSDHALDRMMYAEADVSTLDEIVRDGLNGPVDTARADQLRTALLLALARRYTELGWVMQIHYGCLRNNASRMFDRLGPDTGFDSVSDAGGAPALAALLDAMDRENALPRTVLYSLNQHDNEIIASIAGGFQTDGGCPSRVQIGSAWWFNDHKTGMEKQLTDLANLGTLGNFIGMLTDSRSFLSYTRHEYFRRILCGLIGGWIENGELPWDEKLWGGIVRDICFNNTNRFFGFGLPEA